MHWQECRYSLFFSTCCEVRVLSIGFILFQCIYTLLSQISKWRGLCLQKCGLWTCDKLQLWWNPNLGTFVALPGAAPDLEIKIFNGFSHFRLFKTCLRDFSGFTGILITVYLHLSLEGSDWKFYFIPFQSCYRVVLISICKREGTY